MEISVTQKPSRSGSETRRRRKRLLVRLDDLEYAEVVVGAEAVNLTLASFARQKVLSGPVRKPSRRVSPDIALLARLLGELNRVGSNLNQIARALNTGDVAEPGELTAALAEFRALADAIMVALGFRDDADHHQRR